MWYIVAFIENKDNILYEFLFIISLIQLYKSHSIIEVKRKNKIISYKNGDQNLLIAMLIIALTLLLLDGVLYALILIDYKMIFDTKNKGVVLLFGINM